MRINMSGTVTQLAGDFTLTEMTYSNIDALVVSLEQLGSGDRKSLQIDCGQIKDVDASGLQLFYIWLQCLRFRGIEPELFNIPRVLRKTFEILGVRMSSAATSAEISVQNNGFSKQRQGRSMNRHQRTRKNCQSMSA